MSDHETASTPLPGLAANPGGAPPLHRHPKAGWALLLLPSVLLLGCDLPLAAPAEPSASIAAQPATSSAPPTPSAPPTRSPTASVPEAAATGPLRVEDWAWLGGFDGVVQVMVGWQEDASVDEVIIETPEQMLAEAQRMRSCRDELAKLGPPSARVRSIYDRAVDACEEYEAAAECAETVASFPSELWVESNDDAQLQEINEASDCWIARAYDAGNLLIDAHNEATTMRVEIETGRS